MPGFFLAFESAWFGYACLAADVMRTLLRHRTAVTFQPGTNYIDVVELGSSSLLRSLRSPLRVNQSLRNREESKNGPTTNNAESRLR